MKIIKIVRTILTALMIGFASIFPIYYKDESPKYHTEIIEIKDDDKDD